VARRSVAHLYTHAGLKVSTSASPVNPFWRQPIKTRYFIDRSCARTRGHHGSGRRDLAIPHRIESHHAFAADRSDFDHVGVLEDGELGAESSTREIDVVDGLPGRCRNCLTGRDTTSRSAANRRRTVESSLARTRFEEWFVRGLSDERRNACLPIRSIVVPPRGISRRPARAAQVFRFVARHRRQYRVTPRAKLPEHLM
jgi:hypothetical protein